MKGAGRALAGAWSRFWFGEVDGLPYGLARIGVAAAGLQLWLGTVPLVRRYYSDAGEYPIEAAARWGTEWVSRFAMVEPLGSFPVTVALFALWGMCLTALLLGWRTRLAAWGSWLLTVWFLFRNPTFNNGGDELLRLSTFYFALGFLALRPRERALSLDRRRALRRMDEAVSGGAVAAARMPAWPLRLLQLQLAFMYLVAGFWKVFGPPWWDGTALWHALANSAFSRFGVAGGAEVEPLFVALTVSVAWWELLFPFLVWWERARRWMLGFGVFVHGAILVFMNIGVFPFIVLGLYPVFLRPDEARSLVDAVAGLARRLGGRQRRAPSGASPPPDPSPDPSSAASAP